MVSRSGCHRKRGVFIGSQFPSVFRAASHASRKRRDRDEQTWEVGGIRFDNSANLCGSKEHHGLQFTGICVISRKVRFHRIWDFKHYYFNSILHRPLKTTGWRQTNRRDQRDKCSTSTTYECNAHYLQDLNFRKPLNNRLFILTCIPCFHDL